MKAAQIFHMLEDGNKQVRSPAYAIDFLSSDLLLGRWLLSECNALNIS
jgi:hypothetical protein